MARIDYHLHTDLCKHACGTMDEYINRAIEVGLDEIGFADHNPLPGGFDSRHRMHASQLPGYVSMVHDAQLRFPQITVKCGLEADYLPGGEAFLRDQIGRYPFDYVYGSVHFLGDWNFDNPVFVHQWNDHDVDKVYQWYFDSLKQLIDSGLFDIVSHPDLVKKFGHRPRALALEPLYEDICRSLRAAGMCLELNTSGLRKDVAEMYPARRFIEIASHNSVPVIIGSDAHCPGDVGADYDRAREMLSAAGYKHIQRFSNRRREAVPL